MIGQEIHMKVPQTVFTCTSVRYGLVMPISRRLIPQLISLLMIVPVFSACSTRPSNSLADDTTNVDWTRWAIDTLVEETLVIAGSTVNVTCAVQAPLDVEDAAIPLQVIVSPDAVSVERTANNQFTVRLEAALEYRLACAHTEGYLQDTTPAELEVVAADAVSFEAIVSSEIAIAGEEVLVDCEGVDAFGNPALDPVDLQVVVDTSVQRSSHYASDFSLRGTLVGQYDINCLSESLGASDATPPSLSVLAGPASQSETLVSATEVYPEDLVDVTCAYFDAYGNPVDGVESEIRVMPSGGNSEGLVVGASSFSATGAGSYFVFCASPNQLAGDESPPIVSVLPGLPFSWVVDTLEQDCYWQDREIPMSWTVYDAYGNPIEDVEVEVTAIPADGLVQNQDGTYRLSAQADYDLTVRLVSETAEGAEIEDVVVNVRVDSTPPSFDWQDFPRGFMLQEGNDDDQVVAVVAQASDLLSPLIGFSVNETQWAMPQGDTLSATLTTSETSNWGLNVLVGYAEDACGNRRVVETAYLRSGNYGQALTESRLSARHQGGIVAQLNQPVLDDGDRSDLDDLASLAEATLRGLDLNALLAPGQALVEDPINPRSCSWGQFTSDTGYRVGRHSDASRPIVLDNPKVGILEAVDSGVHMTAAVGNFAFPLEASGGLIVCAGIAGVEPAEISVAGTVGAQSIDVDATISLRLQDGVPEASMQSITLDTVGLYINLDCGWADFLCDAITGTFVPLLEGLVEDAIEGVIADQVPALLEDVLGQLQIDTGFDLPAPIEMRLNLASGFDQILFEGPAGGEAGFGRLGLEAQVFPSERAAFISDNAKGEILRNSMSPDLRRSPYAFGLALKEALVNQIFWALWYGGGLELNDLLGTLAADAPGDQEIDDILELTIRSELPPVLMTSDDDWDFTLGWGDVYLEAAVDLGPLLGGEGGEGVLNVGAYLSAMLSAEIDIDPTTNELVAIFDDEPMIAVEVVSIDDEGYQGVMSDLLRKVLKLLMPRLLGSAIGSFPLPEFDLSALAGDGILPEGAVWRISGAELENDSNSRYIYVTGSLQ